MINPFILNPYERIRFWRDLRDSLPQLPFKQQLSRVSDFWWQAPMQTFVLDYDRPETWPSPWELIYSNGFDSVARGLMMAETFLLTYEESMLNKIKLCYVKDYVIEDMVMLVFIDEFILNHQFKVVQHCSDIEGHYNVYSTLYKTDIKGKWIEL